MFKKALILLLVLLLSSAVFSVRLIDPISKELNPTDNFVGTVAAGNVIEFIFSKELTIKYEELEVLTSLPKNFSYNVKYEKESIKLFVSVPKDAPIGDYPLSVRFFGKKSDDKVGLFFTVVSGALDVSPSSAALVSVPVGAPAEYKFFFVNNTDGSAIFNIENSLPANWNENNLFVSKTIPKRVVVPKRQNLEESVFVYPRLQGEKEFLATVSFENTSKEFGFVVNGVPSIKSKLEVVSIGLPFYSFSLLPSYFVNGLISFWLS